MTNDDDESVRWSSFENGDGSVSVSPVLKMAMEVLGGPVLKMLMEVLVLVQF